MLAGREHGFAAAGLGARDTLRMEAAMPLYGHELDEAIDPLTAGLRFACTLKDRAFIGDSALQEIDRAGPAKRRIGLLPEGKRPARQGCEVLDVRRLGSSPAVGRHRLSGNRLRWLSFRLIMRMIQNL